VELTLVLARRMLELVGIDADPAAALDDGRALAAWDAMVRAQGGDPDAPLAVAPFRRTVDAPAGGVLTRLDARAVGVAAWRLGAGRARKGDPVSAGAGVVCLRKPGDPVEPGEPVLELHADEEDRFAGAIAALGGAFDVGEEAPAPTPLVLESIG
jgi:thymidine phosphorylase